MIEYSKHEIIWVNGFYMSDTGITGIELNRKEKIALMQNSCKA